MDGEAEKPKRRRIRALSEEERKLWSAVVHDARPLKRRRRAPEPAPAPEPEAAAQTVEKPVSKPKQVAVAAIFPMPVRPPARFVLTPSAPPLNSLDRRTSQRLARGQIEAEARLDLHGMRQEEAHSALLGFLARTRAQGLRCVLVITGKGESPFARHILHSTRYHDAPEHSGVLRGLLPQWLGEAEARLLVAGFQPAHPRHGGGGAFYIWLRKRK